MAGPILRSPIEFSTAKRYEDQREIEMIIIVLISVLAMLVLQAAPPWARTDALYAWVLFDTILAVVIHQSWNRGVVRGVINLLAAAFGAFLAIPVLYWGMRLVDPVIPAEMTIAVGYVFAAIGTIIIVFFSWSPIRIIDLFRRH
jgi:hypothetical protein